MTYAYKGQGKALAVKDDDGDAAAQGNGIQLLGRAYLRVNNVDGFERTMAQSEELTHAFDPKVSSTHGHYSLGTVYEEYGRSYANLGLMQKALDYLDLAKPELPQTKFWDLLLTRVCQEVCVNRCVSIGVFGYSFPLDIEQQILTALGRSKRSLTKDSDGI